VRLSGGASGSLDGFGQLTALSELHLDSNRFNGKSPSTCLPKKIRAGYWPMYCAVDAFQVYTGHARRPQLPAKLKSVVC